jgi:hypothetical protein
MKEQQVKKERSAEERRIENLSEKQFRIEIIQLFCQRSGIASISPSFYWKMLKLAGLW